MKIYFLVILVRKEILLLRQQELMEMQSQTMKKALLEQYLVLDQFNLAHKQLLNGLVMSKQLQM